jgi:hypothetical protein
LSFLVLEGVAPWARGGKKPGNINFRLNMALKAARALACIAP